MWTEAGSVVVGWAVGANDAAAVAAPGVGAGAISVRRAGIMSAVCVMVGALLYGGRGVRTFAGLGAPPEAAAPAVLAAAVMVLLLLRAGLPGSVTQCVGGGIMGAALAYGKGDFSVLGGLLLAWVASPAAGAAAGALLLTAASVLVNRLRPSLFVLDAMTRPILLSVSAGAAFALGANNAATTGAAFAQAGMLSPERAAAAGGVLIALGAVLPNRGILRTIGGRIVHLETLSAACVLAAVAAVVYGFALLGKPVSLSQTLVGGVLGVGAVRGLHTVRWIRVGEILLAWVAAPLFAAIMGFAFVRLAVALEGPVPF